MELDSLTGEEKVYFSLKNLYEGFGYRQYRMRKFEEYSLYAENKNFLKSKDIITFSDRDGKLLALKPDVTLSIVKNSRIEEGQCRKLYYRESVYRPDSNARFKEISQIGLEYLGDVDGYAQLEVLALASKSLKAVDSGYVIDISHMGVIDGIMEECGFAVCPDSVSDCIKSKNLHDLPFVCSAAGIPRETCLKLCRLLSVKGGHERQLGALRGLFSNPKCLAAADGLESIITGLDKSGIYGFDIDFSVINDATYYNGVVFHGYLEKFPRVVLSGGRYDNLVKKFCEKTGGMGFALYADELSYYYGRQPGYDADILLLYGGNISPAEVLLKAEKYIGEGYTVRVSKTVPENMRFSKVVKV